MALIYSVKGALYGVLASPSSNVSKLANARFGYVAKLSCDLSSDVNVNAKANVT